MWHREEFFRRRLVSLEAGNDVVRGSPNFALVNLTAVRGRQVSLMRAREACITSWTLVILYLTRT